jgi:hypothetical protein
MSLRDAIDTHQMPRKVDIEGKLTYTAFRAVGDASLEGAA